jgi:DNA-directed RNA polymerase specialized sigma24 family protein
MQMIDEVEQQQLYWAGLVERIAAGELSAKREFRDTYRPGIRFLFQRRIGTSGLETAVDQVVHQIVDEVTAGRLTKISEMARLVRRMIAEHEAEGVVTPIVTVRDSVRLKGRAEQLDRALVKFSEPERQALIGYYARGYSGQEIENQFGIGRDALGRLRERLVLAIQGPMRRGPGSERPAALVRIGGGLAAG